VDVEGFEVPEYIKDAINWATKSEEEDVQQVN
jgi:hypothetical protein